MASCWTENEDCLHTLEMSLQSFKHFCDVNLQVAMSEFECVSLCVCVSCI